MNLRPKKKKPVPHKKTPKSQAQHQAGYRARLKTDPENMASLSLKAERAGEELAGQLYTGAEGGAKGKKNHETQIEKVSDSTEVNA